MYRALCTCLFLFAAGCTSSPAATSTLPACVVAHPVPAGSSPSSEALVQQGKCQTDKGSGCTASLFISQDAAVCVATGAGLAAGIAPWQVQIVYHYGDKVVYWQVRNTLHDDGHGAMDGEGVAVHATTAAVGGKYGWGQIP